MNIINVVEISYIGGNEAPTIYVVTLGATGRDVAVYYNGYGYIGDTTPDRIASGGSKLSKRDFGKLEHILLTGLMHDLPDDWYYRA